MNENVFQHEELRSMQETGEWPIVDSQLLATKYKDRFAMAERLMKKMNTDVFFEINSIENDESPVIENWKDENIPDKSFSHWHQGPVYGYDIDTMVGPTDWHGDIGDADDYVQRRKVYIFDWTADKLNETAPEELQYFVNMHTDFKPILEYYAEECYSEQKPDWGRVLHKLMIIEYSTPTANDANRSEHRAHNTERFGDEHCDETLAGLHLGENYVEFHAKNTKTEKWETIDGLENNQMLWMFGEHAERSGWKVTTHGMTHNPDPNLDTRYSIIFDLQARYNTKKIY